MHFNESLCRWQYAEYEQVVVEDRIEKEKARRKVDQEAREIAAAVKVRFNSVYCFYCTLQTGLAKCNEM